MDQPSERSPVDGRVTGDAAPGPATGPGPDLAEAARPGRLRLALAAQEQRNGLLARRAERLARIRATAAARDRTEGDAEAVADEEAVDALERFLAGLVGTIDCVPPPPQPARLAPAIVPLARAGGGDTDTAPAGAGNAAAPAGAEGVAPSGHREDVTSRAPAGAEGLARLPGAGPGLVATLIRAGVPDLQTLAALGAPALAERLGPLARLIDLEAWIAFARGAAAEDFPAAG
jgi:hypothetical protein